MYILCTQMLALCHIGFGHQVYIHWIHRVVLISILVVSVVATIFIDSIWRGGWKLQYISLMVRNLSAPHKILSVIFNIPVIKRSNHQNVIICPDNSALFTCQRRCNDDIFVMVHCWETLVSRWLKWVEIFLSLSVNSLECIVILYKCQMVRRWIVIYWNVNPKKIISTKLSEVDIIFLGLKFDVNRQINHVK